MAQTRVDQLIAQYPEALDNLMYDVLVLHKNFPGAELDKFAQHNPEHQHLCGLIQYIRQHPDLSDMLTWKFKETHDDAHTSR